MGPPEATDTLMTEASEASMALERQAPDTLRSRSTFSATNPFASFECAFGYLSTLPATPKSPEAKETFLEVVDSETRAAKFIQGGLKSYLAAITNGTYQFSQPFLDSQSIAVETTVEQLAAVEQRLVEIRKCVEGCVEEDAEVPGEVRTALEQAGAWIIRCRANLVSAHVFYKINYALVSKHESSKED